MTTSIRDGLSDLPAWFLKTKEGKRIQAEAAKEERTERERLRADYDAKVALRVAADPAHEDAVRRATEKVDKLRPAFRAAEQELTQAILERQAQQATHEHAVRKAELVLRATCDPAIAAFRVELYYVDRELRKESDKYEPIREAIEFMLPMRQDRPDNPLNDLELSPKPSVAAEIEALREQVFARIPESMRGTVRRSVLRIIGRQAA